MVINASLATSSILSLVNITCKPLYSAHQKSGDRVT